MEADAREIAWGMALARKLAYCLAPSWADHAGLGLDVDDLTSVGMIAVIAALRSYDSKRGAALRTHVLGQVQWAIRKEIYLKTRRRLPTVAIADLGIDDWANTEPGPAEVAGGLRRLVSELPHLERDTIHLRFWGEKTFREIARRLQISEPRVRRLQAKALIRLRQWMEE